MTVILVDGDGCLVCPECGGLMLCSMEIHASGIRPHYTNSGRGAYLFDKVDADPDDADNRESDLSSLYCEECGYTIEEDELNTVRVCGPKCRKEDKFWQRVDYEYDCWKDK